MSKMLLNKVVLSFTERITTSSVDETRTRTCINGFMDALTKSVVVIILDVHVFNKRDPPLARLCDVSIAFSGLGAGHSLTQSHCRGFSKP